MKAYELRNLLQSERALETLTIGYNSHSAIYVNVRLNDKRYKINIEDIKCTNDFYLECLKALNVLKVLNDGVYIIDDFIIDDNGEVLNFKKPHVILSSKKAKEFLESNKYTLDNLLIHAPLSVKPRLLDNEYYYIVSLDYKNFVLSEMLMFELLYSYLI